MGQIVVGFRFMYIGPGTDAKNYTPVELYLEPYKICDFKDAQVSVQLVMPNKYRIIRTYAMGYYPSYHW